MDNLITKYEMLQACDIVFRSKDCVKTPMLKDVQMLQFKVGKAIDSNVHLKLENMQITGSFKIRGVTNQMVQLEETNHTKVVTMSAGNYGKAFSYACKQHDLKGVVAMPTTAPVSRELVIKENGCKVVRVASHLLMEKMKEFEAEGFRFLHPFDDKHLIAGYSSVGKEITDELIPDVVVVCCGGGGLLSGVAAFIKSHPECEHTRIYGVEPETANSMQRSLNEGRAAQLPQANSIAAGLAPPFAGQNCYRHVTKFVDGIITVTNKQICQATRHLCERGIFAEASGSAAFAAVMFDKIPDVANKCVVVMVTGGNASPTELVEVFGKAFE